MITKRLQQLSHYNSKLGQQRLVHTRAATTANSKQQLMRLTAVKSLGLAPSYLASCVR